MDNRTRLAVLDRDNWTCQECGGPPGPPHHITPKRMGGRHGKARERIESIDNLVTLCRECHKKKHG